MRAQRYAKYTYILAWGIEIIAVTLGLALALAMSSIGLAENGASDLSWLNTIILSSGGFVIVSAAELGKIPLATLLVQVRGWLSKGLILSALILLSGLTFETIFFALERGFELRLARLNGITAELEKLGQERRLIEAGGKRDDADQGRDLADTEKLIKQIQGERDAIKSSLRTPELERLDALAKAKTGEQLELKREQDRAIEQAQKRYEASVSALVKEGPTATLDRLATLTAQRDSSKTALDRARQGLDKGNLRIKLAAEIADINRQRGELLKLDTGTRQKLDELAQKEAAELAKSQERLSGQSGARRTTADNEKTEIRERSIADLQLKLQDAANLSQIHRVASFVFTRTRGETIEPHQVTKPDAKWIAALWFGSVAALGALGGAIIAIVSQLFYRIAEQQSLLGPRAGTMRVLSRSVWRALYAWRHPRIVEKLVEIIVEKRVEVPVEKLVEVVKEVRVKELIPVPLRADGEFDPAAFQAVNSKLATVTVKPAEARS